MAICEVCGHEMATGRSCTARALHRDGVAIEVRSHRGRGRCGDCGVAPGGAHHLGCDLASCPSCGGQLLGCGCRFDELPPDPDDLIEEEEEGVDGTHHPSAWQPGGHR